MQSMTVSMFASVVVAAAGAIKGMVDATRHPEAIVLLDLLAGIARAFAGPQPPAGMSPQGAGASVMHTGITQREVLISSMPRDFSPSGIDAWARSNPVVKDGGGGGP